jgi:hypothetical protein
MSVKSSVARMRFTSLGVVLWRFDESMSCASPWADAASWPSAS